MACSDFFCVFYVNDAVWSLFYAVESVFVRDVLINSHSGQMWLDQWNILSDDGNLDLNIDMLVWVVASIKLDLFIGLKTIFKQVRFYNIYLKN